ncbi:MAG: flagellar basal body P-ring formation chaperone FlgA [Planctomycetota bacterium]
MLASLLLCAAFPAGGSVRIHADALVAGPTVELGEVAEIRVDSPEERDRLSTLSLGSTPAPASVRSVTREDVLRLLRAAGLEVAVGGAAACRARPRVEMVSGSDLEAAARASLAALFAGRDFEIQAVRPTADVPSIAAESRRELSAQLTRSEPVAGHWSVPIDVRADGTRMQTVWVALDVRLFERVPVAARDLRRGEAFQADAWSLERVAIEASAPRSPQPALLQGATSMRDLARGERIVATDVHREILVRSGDDVEIEVVRGLVHARRMAVARGQGAEGDRIEVQSGENQRRLVGVIVARGLVRVELSQSPRNPR